MLKFLDARLPINFHHKKPKIDQLVLVKLDEINVFRLKQQLLFGFLHLFPDLQLQCFHQERRLIFDLKEYEKAKANSKPLFPINCALSIKRPSSTWVSYQFCTWNKDIFQLIFQLIEENSKVVDVFWRKNSICEINSFP